MRRILLAGATLVSASITGVSTIVYNIACKDFRQLPIQQIPVVDLHSCECMEEFCPPCYTSPSPSPAPNNSNSYMENICKVMLGISTIGALATILISSYELNSLGQHNAAIAPENH